MATVASISSDSPVVVMHYILRSI